MVRTPRSLGLGVAYFRAMSGGHPPKDAPRETRLVVSHRRRGVQRLDSMVDGGDDPELSQLLALAPPAGIWLWGGEPTLRPDLPQLLAALQQPRMRTDGLALASPAPLSALQSAGLAGVRVVLHSARSDAHDWLVGMPGAHKRAVRAIRLAVAAGLPVELEATLTRSTLPHVVELVELAARLSVSAVHIRRITSGGAVAAEQVMLTPRIAQARPQLFQAVQLGWSRGVSVMLWGFPHCACPEQPEAFAGAPRWLAVTSELQEEGRAKPQSRNESSSPKAAASVSATGPGDNAALRDKELQEEGRAKPQSRKESSSAKSAVSVSATGLCGFAALREIPSTSGQGTLRCRDCPEACPGAPADYVARFGPMEFVAAPTAAPSVVRVAFCEADGAPIPTRDLRLRLMRAAQVGATTLRIADGTSLSHPATAQLLRECTRLSFQRVELCGEGSGLAALTSGDLYPLRAVSRVDLGLMGADAASHDLAVGKPGAFDATLAAVAQIRKVTGVQTAVYCASEAPDVVAACEAAWKAGALPGAPALKTVGDPGALFTFELQDDAPADPWDRLYSPR